MEFSVNICELQIEWNYGVDFEQFWVLEVAGFFALFFREIYSERPSIPSLSRFYEWVRFQTWVKN